MTQVAPRVPPPHFLVVGSPRSGTTLVQRLATELPGVRVPPETHFFAGYYERRLRHRPFPLDEPALRAVLADYLALPALHGITLDVDEVVAQLGGRCTSPWSLFTAIVAALAGDAVLVGEKTPDHLRWWRPLAAASPSLRFVVVLRDPRAVVASAKEAPFGMDTAPVLAARWREDLREIEQALATLPAERIVVVRYEDVVADPDLARARLGAFLGVAGPAVPIDQQAVHLFQPGESGWKAQALGPVDAARASSWRRRLSDRERRQVEAVLSREMARLGYAADSPPPRHPLLRLSPADLLRLAKHSRKRRRQRARIAATSLSDGAVRVG